MKRFGRVALAGVPNVGKSTLLNSMLGTHLAIVSPKPQATRLPVTGILTEGDTQIVFYDLPGLLDPRYLMHERMVAAAHELLGQADLILHLHPAPEAPAPPFASVARLERGLAAPVLVTYTKADLVAPPVRERLAEGALVLDARDAASVRELVGRVADRMPEGDFEHDPEDIGTQPLRFFVVEYLREAAFDLLGDELPYAFTAEVEEFREDESPMYIRVTLFIERDSQKGMVIGRGGQTIKALGTHARARLEALTGSPVYLDLWVKVLPKWRKSAAALARFGFPASETESA
jgi:GTP-binding protein Era